MEEAQETQDEMSSRFLDLYDCPHVDCVLILKLDLLSPHKLLIVAFKSIKQPCWRKTQGLLKHTLFYCTEHKAQQTWLLAMCCKTKGDYERPWHLRPCFQAAGNLAFWRKRWSEHFTPQQPLFSKQAWACEDLNKNVFDFDLPLIPFNL